MYSLPSQLWDIVRLCWSLIRCWYSLRRYRYCQLSAGGALIKMGFRWVYDGILYIGSCFWLVWCWICLILVNWWLSCCVFLKLLWLLCAWLLLCCWVMLSLNCLTIPSRALFLQIFKRFLIVFLLLVLFLSMPWGTITPFFALTVSLFRCTSTSKVLSLPIEAY